MKEGREEDFTRSVDPATWPHHLGLCLNVLVGYTATFSMVTWSVHKILR